MSPGLVSGMIIGDMLDSYSGLLIFSVVVELQNSGYPRNPAKFTKYHEFAKGLIKYMSMQHISNSSWLLGL